MVTVDSIREAHADEHEVPVRQVENRLAAFRTGLGAVLNRTGGMGGTEMSEDAHHVAGADRAAADLVEHGDV